MRRDEALRRLREHRESLTALGVGRLYLHGSVARDQADQDSDIDLLVDPAETAFLLFDLKRVQDERTRVLGRAAELHDYRGLQRSPAVRARVSADLVNVF